MRRRTINDVEYVADAMIIGYLQAASVNYELAAKEFKRHHYDLKDTNVARTFDAVRRLSAQTHIEFCDFCNKKVQQAREESVRREIERGVRKCQGR